eukprot:gene7436-5235_t
MILFRAAAREISFRRALVQYTREHPFFYVLLLFSSSSPLDSLRLFIGLLFFFSTRLVRQLLGLDHSLLSLDRKPERGDAMRPQRPAWTTPGAKSTSTTTNGRLAAIKRAATTSPAACLSAIEKWITPVPGKPAAAARPSPPPYSSPSPHTIATGEKQQPLPPPAVGAKRSRDSTLPDTQEPPQEESRKDTVHRSAGRSVGRSASPTASRRRGSGPKCGEEEEEAAVSCPAPPPPQTPSSLPDTGESIETTSTGAAAPVESKGSASPPPSKRETPVDEGTAAGVPLPLERGHVVLRDAIPFFRSLLEGALGDAVVDVELMNSVSLLRHPQQFKCLVDGLTSQHQAQATSFHSSAPPARAGTPDTTFTDPEQLLSSIRVFLYVVDQAEDQRSCDALHTNNHHQKKQPMRDEKSHASAHPLRVLLLSASVGPVLPLLAMLLAEPRVKKILLHPRLVYRLLFTFLGTERVEMESVVDLQIHACVLSGIAQLGGGGVVVGSPATATVLPEPRSPVGDGGSAARRPETQAEEQGSAGRWHGGTPTNADTPTPTADHAPPSSSEALTSRSSTSRSLSLPEAVARGVDGMLSLLPGGVRAVIEAHVEDIHERAALTRAGVAGMRPTTAERALSEGVLLHGSALMASSSGTDHHEFACASDVDDVSEEEEEAVNEAQEVQLIGTEWERRRSCRQQQRQNTEKDDQSAEPPLPRNPEAVLETVMPWLSCTPAQLLTQHEVRDVAQAAQKRWRQRHRQRGLVFPEAENGASHSNADSAGMTADEASRDVSFQILADAFWALSVVSAFYATHLRPLESRHAASSIPTGPLQLAENPCSLTSSSSALQALRHSPLLALEKVSSLRAYAAFLCEAMCIHGVYVSQWVFESMQGDILRQVNALVRCGQSWVEGELVAWYERAGQRSGGRPAGVGASPPPQRDDRQAASADLTERDGAFEMLDVQGVLRWMERRLSRAQLPPPPPPTPSSLPPPSGTPYPPAPTAAGLQSRVPAGSYDDEWHHMDMVEDKDGALPPTQPMAVHRSPDVPAPSESPTIPAQLRTIKDAISAALQERPLKTTLLRIVQQLQQVEQCMVQHNQQQPSSSPSVPTPYSLAVEDALQLGILWLGLRERLQFRSRLSSQLHGLLRIQPIPGADTHSLGPQAPPPTDAAPKDDAQQEKAGSSLLGAQGVDDGTAPSFLDRLTLVYSVHPRWELHTWSTGRIFASQPNLQHIDSHPIKAVYPLPHHLLVEEVRLQQLSQTPAPAARAVAPAAPDLLSSARGEAEEAALERCRHLLFPSNPSVTLRHLYIPPPGCVFLSLDFNQVELRLLAHFSEDPALLAALSQHEDVLAGMVRQIMGNSTSRATALTTGGSSEPPSMAQRRGRTSRSAEGANDPSPPRSQGDEEVSRGQAATVSEAQRSAAKIVFYGFIYGMGAKKMVQAVEKVLRADTAASPAAPASAEARSDGNPLSSESRVSARQFIDRVAALYPRMMRYLQRTREEAQRHRRVFTLSGQRDLSLETNPFLRQQRAVAFAIQGSAADLLQLAMRAVHQQRHAFLPYFPICPFALCMVVHDELVFTVAEGALPLVAPKIRQVMEAQAGRVGLRVPLKVKVKAGTSLGTLQELQC